AEFYKKFLSTWFKVQAATTTPFDLATIARLTRILDNAEITVMMLAKELQGTAVLDEKAARREAERLAVRFIGTLGLLEQAVKRKWMTDAQCMARVIQLCDGGFHIPRPAPHLTFAEYLRILN